MSEVTVCARCREGTHQHDRLPDGTLDTCPWQAVAGDVDSVCQCTWRGMEIVGAAGPPDVDPGLLTPDEHAVIRQAGDLWNLLCRIVPDGPTRGHDLLELGAHVHAIQHAVMAQACARAYPDTYRLLGLSLTAER